MMSVTNTATNKPHSRRIRTTLANYQHAVDYVTTTYGVVPVTIVAEGTFAVTVYFTPKETN
jgi:hypothetical protein